MALLGDTAGVTRVLDTVARDAAREAPQEGVVPRVWLLGLARAACATHLSRIPVRLTGPLPAPAAVATEASVARESLGRLKPTEREAVVLHLIGGLDAMEVAAACGVPASTARTRLARGLAELATIGIEGERR